MSKNSKMWLYSAVVALAFAFNANAGVSGFVDAQFASGINVTGSPDNSPTFRVGDGAVYWTDKMGAGSVMLDIPFMFGATGTSNDFRIATGKAQAYITWAYDNGLSWSLGQWDSIWGHERNDSKDNRFAQQGLIYGALPTTHAGLLLDYTKDGVTVKAYAANAQDQGLRSGDNMDFGGQLKYAASQFYFAGGYQHHKSASTGESSMLANFLLGTKQGAFTADAEVSLGKVAAVGAETGTGFGVWLGYDVNSAWNVAGRFEYLSKVGGINSNMQWTLGPSHKCTDKLTLRAEYTGTSTTVLTGGTAVSNNGGILSGVYKF